MRSTLITVLLLVFAVLSFVYLRWPRRQADVQPASLSYPKPLQWIFGPGYRDTAFQLTEDEEEALAQCSLLLQRYRQFINGKRQFATPEVRGALEKILKEQPDFFYAEYLLALWFRGAGDDIAAARHYNRAIKLAPVVLVQPYRDMEGNPLVGATIDDFVVACCRVRKRTLDYVDLAYVDLTTDEAGELEIPVFDAVFLRSRITLPDGYKMIYPPLGFFKSTARVGVLPAAIAKECPPLEAGKSPAVDVGEKR